MLLIDHLRQHSLQNAASPRPPFRYAHLVQGEIVWSDLRLGRHKPVLGREHEPPCSFRLHHISHFLETRRAIEQPRWSGIRQLSLGTRHEDDRAGEVQIGSSRKSPRCSYRLLSCRELPIAGTYFPSRRPSWFCLVRAMSALDTDCSPDLLPFTPIRFRISPRVRPSGCCWTTPRTACRFSPLRALGAAVRLARFASALPRSAGPATLRLLVGGNGGELAFDRLELSIDIGLASGAPCHGAF
jgi:hypothetical protein